MPPDPRWRTIPGLPQAAVKPHAGKDIHVILDNLSTHTTPDVAQWLADNPHVSFHFTPVGSSWMNQRKQFWRPRSGGTTIAPSRQITMRLSSFSQKAASRPTGAIHMRLTEAFSAATLDEIKAALDGGKLEIYSTGRPPSADHARDA